MAMFWVYVNVLLVNVLLGQIHVFRILDVYNGQSDTHVYRVQRHEFSQWLIYSLSVASAHLWACLD